MALTYTAIATVTVGSGGASSIDFSSIPGTYTDLLIKASIRTNQSNVFGSFFFSLNGSTSNFSSRYLYGTGSAVGSGTDTLNQLPDMNGDTSTANTFGNCEIYIPNYTGSNYKSISADGVSENNATTAYAELWAKLWSNTSAITSMSFTATGNFMQYSSITLYGIKNTV